MRHPTHRITHTTAFVTPVVGHWLEREIAGTRIDPNALTTELHLAPRFCNGDNWPVIFFFQIIISYCVSIVDKTSLYKTSK